jgi:hypothetical protein
MFQEMIYLLIIEQTGMILFQIYSEILFFVQTNVSEKNVYKKTIKT